MPCHAMQCILCKIYFWKVFLKYYNLICIFICTPICTKILFLQKVGVTEREVAVGTTATCARRRSGRGTRGEAVVSERAGAA